MFGNNIVQNGRIHQEVKWNAPVLKYNAKPMYLIQYADDSSRVLSDSKFEFSSDPSTTLQLTFGTSNITYYVVVAVTQTAEQGTGDFSDLVSIAYTSEFIMRTVKIKAQSLLNAQSQTHVLCAYVWESYILPLLKHTAPGLPEDLTLVNRTCHSVTFQWSPPDDTGRLDVTGYDILHNGTPVANITGTVYTLEGLTPDTVHTISVRTRNAIGTSVLAGKMIRRIEGQREYNDNHMCTLMK